MGQNYSTGVGVDPETLGLRKPFNTHSTMALHVPICKNNASMERCTEIIIKCFKMHRFQKKVRICLLNICANNFAAGSFRPQKLHGTVLSFKMLRYAAIHIMQWLRIASVDQDAMVAPSVALAKIFGRVHSPSILTPCLREPFTNCGNPLKLNTNTPYAVMRCSLARKILKNYNPLRICIGKIEVPRGRD